jgi:hypothetical protein
MPDIKPKPNSDGSCFVYQTKTGDSCSVIAASSGSQCYRAIKLQQEHIGLEWLQATLGGRQHVPEHWRPADASQY